MPVSVTMPRLGESVAEGTVTRWLKNEGDQVEADEPLLEISTDKVDTEIPSPASGVLRRISVAEDETVEVGSELAVIEEGGEAAGVAAAGRAEAPAEEPEEPEEPAPAPTAPEAAPEEAPAAAEPAAVAEPEPAAEPETAPERPAPPAPEERPAAEAPPPPPPAPAPREAEREAPEEPTPLPSAGEGAYVTPLVRKLATEHGVDLAKVNGTGVGGRIRKQDVLDAARAQPAKPETPAQPAAVGAPAATVAAPSPVATELRGRTEKMSRTRQIIAQRMHESLQVSAQLTTVVEVDVTEIARLRDRAKDEFQAREGVKLSFLPFFALATVEALKVHPKVNAVIDTENKEITYYEAEHLGIAVDTDKGLLVPVIRDAGDLNIAGLARKIADVAERARAGRALPDELSGGTFTITNTGSRGALIDTPIINQPQVGVLGTGSVVKRPVVVDDSGLGEVIAVRSMMYLSLTYDHRLVDGADAARFLVSLKSRLEEGNFEAELGLT